MRVVIGIGNEHRRDDGFGPAVIARMRGLPAALDTGLRLVVSDGEPARLIEAWSGAELVVLVDTARGGARVGERAELSVAEIVDWPATSSHRVSLVDTIALARALDRLPPTVVVLAAVGEDFGYGAGLSPALAEAVEPVAARAAQLASC